MEELRNYVEDRNKRSIAIFKHLHTSTKVELNFGKRQLLLHLSHRGVRVQQISTV